MVFGTTLERCMHQKSGKASFGHIYDLRDPKEYYTTLGRMDYKAPEHGRRLFSALLEKRFNAGPVNVVDLCCSYGVNATLLKYDVVLDDLYDRYSSDALSLSGNELAEADATYYAGRERQNAPRVVGVDVAENAVSYALKAGLLDAGAAEDLENQPPSDSLKREVSGADLFTVTGGIGYITERTFDRLLGCVDEGRDPWVAVLALRWVSYGKISAVLGEHGLVTEKLEGRTFEQRRFADGEERDYVCEELEKMGIDPKGKEDEGSYHAEFYLSRPAKHVEEASVEELVGIG